MFKISRTLCAIHFKELDPHRFEDLVREMAYDFKDWQSIEETGFAGTDAGIDIRAYERVSCSSDESEDEDIKSLHLMSGNRWTIQCKREKEIGPGKLSAILEEVDIADPPYGYILAAPLNFSKASHDVFREKLLEKGVMEFYLWGRSELEALLHQPKNGRILFTFLGISLVLRRRSRSAEIRSNATSKNKLLRALGEGMGH